MLQQHVHAKKEKKRIQQKNNNPKQQENTGNKCLIKVIKSKMLETLKIYENKIC